CDGAAPGFSAVAADHVVTVVFTPPTSAPRRIVVLSSDCSAIAPQLDDCATQAHTTPSCVQVDPLGDPASLAVVMRGGDRDLSFRFPDTDALLSPAGDARTLTGPVTIAVTNRTDPLPCDLTTIPCR